MGWDRKRAGEGNLEEFTGKAGEDAGKAFLTATVASGDPNAYCHSSVAGYCWRVVAGCDAIQLTLGALVLAGGWRGDLFPHVAVSFRVAVHEERKRLNQI